ncbi:hypothetical protein GGS21DRAFT_211448 [Xylaria nigripes]|nr:hypothetical protein GGS21DRAFT_211448 [Xylaria nigripes]
MKASSVARGFRVFAGLAVILLWGFYAFNGGLKANLLAPLNGRLDEDTPLKNDYTGIFIIDYPVSLLVAFFYFMTDASDEGAQLLVFEGYSTLQSSFVWLYAEMIRPGNKPLSITRPVIFNCLSQVLGGAISLPLYFAYHVIWVDSTEILRVRDQGAAMALPWSFLIGAVLPTILGCAPTWNGPNSRAPEIHQKYLAFFQVDPLWVILTQIILTKVFGQICSNDGGNAPRTAHKWTRVSYLAAAASATIGHLYTIARIYNSTDERTNLLRMYLPVPPYGPTDGVPNPIARGTFLYLQFDVLIFGTASLMWVFWLLLGTTHRLKMSALKLATLLVIGGFTIGVGATVSLALYVREGILPEKEKEKN